jgi:hypothetical protein
VIVLMAENVTFDEPSRPAFVIGGSLLRGTTLKIEFVILGRKDPGTKSGRNLPIGGVVSGEQ